MASANTTLVNTAGNTSYQFTVTYSDPQGAAGAINTAGIINNNNAIRVTGPGGFNVLATYVSIDNAANGTPRTATYSITPPGGTWDPLDFGTYTVSIQANQVADIDGNFIVADTIGSFSVLSPYVVTNADDAGAGSLRDAITLANTTASPDTIVFSPTFFNVPRTITLLTALPTFPANGGAMTINGTGEANLTIQRDSAAPNFRVFSSLAPALTLTGMTVSGGNISGNGGGIEATGTLTLDHVVLSGNRATGVGGGIHMAPGFLMVRNSTITGNTSTGSSGGGVRVYGGSLLVENSTISNNSSAGGNGGGGLYFGGTASATPPIGFTANTLVIRNSTVSGNSTTTTSSLGGGGIGVINFTGTLLVQNSVVSGNSAATNGGGISLHYGTVTVQNSTISGNTTGTLGGGISVFGSNTTVNVQNSTIAGNTAGVPSGAILTASGGGIAVNSGNGPITIQNSTIVGNTAFGNAAGTGGGGLARTTTNSRDDHHHQLGYRRQQQWQQSGHSHRGHGFDRQRQLQRHRQQRRVHAVRHQRQQHRAGHQPEIASIRVRRWLDANDGSGLWESIDRRRSKSACPGWPHYRSTGCGLLADRRVGRGHRRRREPGAVPPRGRRQRYARSRRPGTQRYQFTVTYSDPQGAAGAINTAGIINNNNAIRVTGPGGFNVLATYVSIDNASERHAADRDLLHHASRRRLGPARLWNVHGQHPGQSSGRHRRQLHRRRHDWLVRGQLPLTSSRMQTTAGAGSLRDAITQANTTASPDTIVFSPAFFNVPRTITLVDRTPDVSGERRGRHHHRHRRNQPDRSSATRPRRNFRVFSSLAPTLTLTGMTVSGGNISGNGGGIEATGTLTLDHVVLSGNRATGVGGAIHMSPGFLMVRNSTITGNTAAQFRRRSAYLRWQSVRGKQHGFQQLICRRQRRRRAVLRRDGKREPADRVYAEHSGRAQQHGERQQHDDREQPRRRGHQRDQFHRHAAGAEQRRVRELGGDQRRRDFAALRDAHRAEQHDFGEHDRDVGGGIAIFGSNTTVNLLNSTIAGNTAGVPAGPSRLRPAAALRSTAAMARSRSRTARSSGTRPSGMQPGPGAAASRGPPPRPGQSPSPTRSSPGTAMPMAPTFSPRPRVRPSTSTSAPSAATPVTRRPAPAPTTSRRAPT